MDWGAGPDKKYRSRLTEIVREEAPGLILEHARNCGPLNDDNAPWDHEVCTGIGRFETWGKVMEQAIGILSCSDVFRSYDVTAQLSAATTIDRLAQLYTRTAVNPPALGIINCEDECYLGAALGCSIGIMRSQFFADYPGEDYDPRHTRKRMDEAARTVRWQRLAPAYGVQSSKTIASAKVLYDSWLFKEGDSWASWANGRLVEQGAPAVWQEIWNFP